MEKRHNYVRKCAEHAVQFFVKNDRPCVNGLVLAGSADLKTELAHSDLLDLRLKEIIIATVDVSYGGVVGFNQAIELSSDALGNVKLLDEKKLLSTYFDQISQDTGKYVFSVEDTMTALELGAVETLILHEDLDMHRVTLTSHASKQTDDSSCGDDDANGPSKIQTKFLTTQQLADSRHFVDQATGAKMEMQETSTLVEWLAEHYKQYGCALAFVGESSHEGAQFVRGFGGIGGILRWKVNFAVYNEEEATEGTEHDDGVDFPEYKNEQATDGDETVLHSLQCEPATAGSSRSVCSQMNANAAAWIPNPEAVAFVPSWGAVTPALKVVAPAFTDEVPDAWDAADEAQSEKKERQGKPTEPQPEPWQMTSCETLIPTQGPTPAVEPEPAEVQEQEPPKELGNHREHMNVVFIGHVDAGKSTLCGQIMWQSGNLDERILQRYEDEAKAQNRESWKFAYAMDTNDEERAKGKTVEVGQDFFTTEHKCFTVLDAPGHKTFVPHMISGASQADIGVLVIDARKGEFERGFEKGGQTREHIQLAKTAGVKQLVVVINKMDDPTVEWSEKRYMECKQKLFPFLKQSGFRPKKDCVWLPISALAGINIGSQIPEGVCPWYDGNCLLKTLDGMQTPERLLKHHVRMPISGKYNDMGTIVTGKVESGLISVGDKMIIAPIDMKCTVSYIEKNGEKSSFCEPGDNVKLKIVGADDWEQIEPGFMLCPVDNPIHCTTTFDAELQLLDNTSIICPGFKCVMHVHSVVEDVAVTHLIALADKKTGKPVQGAVKFVREGQTVFVRLKVSRPICVDAFADFDQLGRFMLRDDVKTLGTGIIKRIVDAKQSSSEQIDLDFVV